MRGESKPMTLSFFRKAADIVDAEGNTLYHLVPDKWVKILLGGFVIMLLISIILALMILLNKYDIDRIREHIEVKENAAVQHTQHTGN